MNEPEPLATLLSQALIAHTIELDNEFELRVPNRTSRYGVGGSSPARVPAGERLPRVWPASWVMYANYMQFVDDDGIAVRLLRGAAGGLQRWGYIETTSDDRLARPTDAGRHAKEVWQGLPALVEGRWGARFGTAALDELRSALTRLVGRLDTDLPDYLPILGYGLWLEIDALRAMPRSGLNVAERPLVTLLAQALLALTTGFERRSKVSLAICENVLRLAGDEGVRAAELPRHSGVSKEAIAVASGWLERSGYATAGADPTDGRSRLLTLTIAGRGARDARAPLLTEVEAILGTRSGAEAVTAARSALERLVASAAWGVPRPPATCWRAKAGTPVVLAHHPMVLHRGGYPDGS